MRDANEPDLRLAGLSIRVEGYEFPAATEYWDANWAVVRVSCTARRTVVEHRGPCIHLPELAAWAERCDRLLAGESDDAVLPTMEPYVRVSIDRTGESGGLLARVNITPDNLTQFHDMQFEVDEAQVRRLSGSIRVLLARLPVRGERRPR